MAPTISNTGSGTYHVHPLPSGTKVPFPMACANVSGSGGMRVAIWTWSIRPSTGFATLPTHHNILHEVTPGWQLDWTRSPRGGAYGFTENVGIAIAHKVGGSDSPTLTLTPQGTATWSFTSPAQGHGVSRMFRAQEVSVQPSVMTGNGSPGYSLITHQATPSITFVIATARVVQPESGGPLEMAETDANGWTLRDSAYDGYNPPDTQHNGRLIWTRDLPEDQPGGGLTVPGPTWNATSFPIRWNGTFALVGPAPPGTSTPFRLSRPGRRQLTFAAGWGIARA